MNPPLHYAMIGGGIGAGIGHAHRRAIALDGGAVLAGGAMSSDPQRAVESARELGIEPGRCYPTYQQLFEQESMRDDRVDFVSIVTPNDTHFQIARMALEHGFHVVLDKPATHTSEQAGELKRLADERGLVCCVSYNYSGYPMVRQARAMVRAGRLGGIRKVFVEYHQGWLASDLEATGHKQAGWRVDPARAGLGGALGDIGTHAEHLGSFITGLEIESLRAELRSFVPGRRLDDDATVLIDFIGGAHGVLTASQVCIGRGNGLSIRIYGDLGGLAWNQEHPDELEVAPLDGNPTIYTRGGPDLHDDAITSARVPQGHPEGYLEAFANIYRGAADLIHARQTGEQPSRLAELAPTIADGLQGVRFVEKCVESARSGARVDWV